jgi:hypothetical protein
VYVYQNFEKIFFSNICSEKSLFCEVHYVKPRVCANFRKNNHGCPQTLGYVKILATLYRVKDIYEGTRVCGVTKFLSLLLHGLRRL